MFATKLICVALAAIAGTAEGRLGKGLLGGQLLAPKAATSFGLGKPSCPCVGIEGLNGTAFVHTLANASYPAEVGSRCEAWDDGHEPDHCASESQSPGKGSGWCAQKWCYVDPCECDSKVLEAPPAPSQMFQTVASRATPLYYSYATCGETDYYTSVENKMTCAASKTKEACESSECSWTQHAQWGEVCLGLEVAGLCGAPSEASEWGEPSCPCVGLAGINGSVQVNIGNNKTMAFPAEVGSTCQAWDMDRNTDCVGSKKAEGCDQRWCYVDTKHCKAAEHLPSTYLPKAKVGGSLLHYSYATCGATTPKLPPQGTAPGAVVLPVKPSDSMDGEDEEYPIRHDISMPVTHDNAAEIANAKKALLKKTKHEKTANEIAREEFAKKHGGAPKIDKDAYKDEWHAEWEHGHVPSFRERHPEVPDSMYDRQSDGKASPVGSGRR